MKDKRATDYIAAYVILRKDDKIVFVLRENTSWMNGYYGLPSGKVDIGESFSTAAVREGLEEIGVKIEVTDIKFIHVMHRHDKNDWVDVYFEVDRWEGEPVNAEPHMHSKIEWLNPNNLPDNVIPPVRVALQAIERGEKYSEFAW